MSFLRKITDNVLDNVSTLSPTLGEMRSNQLRREYEREYEREKEVESRKSYCDFETEYSYESIRASIKEARRSELAKEDFSIDLDARYSEMLEHAKKMATSKKATLELPSNVSAGDIDDFISGAEENLKILLEVDFEFDKDFYEYDSIECDARDYNESGFDTKSEAKADCRQSLKSAMEDVKNQYECEKSDLISSAESELDCLKLYISPIKDEFCRIFIDSVNQSHCDAETKKYITKRFDEVFKQWEDNNSKIDCDIDNEYSVAMAKIAKSYFKEEESDLSRQTALLELCDFSQNWRDEYKYNMSGACSTLVKEHTSIIKYAMKELPAIMFRRYEELRYERASKLFKIIYMLK